MRLSRALLDAVEAVLPAPGDPGIATQAVHDRVGGWNRTTVRHALRELIREGRAGFSGRDRHRRYRRGGGGVAAPPVPAPSAPHPAAPAASWRDYGLRGDGRVRLPDEREIAAAMRRHRIRYRDVGAAELQREEKIAGWSWRKRTNAELTHAVFGDPPPGRRLSAPRSRPSNDRREA